MSEAAAPGSGRSGTSVAGLFSDSRLARRAIDGDQRAFIAIFHRYHQSLYRYCLAIVGDTQDAQDALQNTMVKVLRALPGEKRQIKLRPWLYRIAHNESVEMLRRRRATAQIDTELVAPGPGLVEEAEVRERLRRLIADLDELPDRQRSALVMRELSGLGFAEIGAALGTSPAVARQTVYEARLSLSQMEGGREMDCTAVTKALSDADGRVTRRRDIRAHLRGCSSCRRFREELGGRQHDLAALAPLPAVAATGLLQGILGAHGSSAGGGLAGTLAAVSGKALGTSAVVKSAATVAVVATVGFSATQADLVPVGLPGEGGSPPVSGGAVRSATPVAPSTAQRGGAGTEPAEARVTEARSTEARSNGKDDLGESGATSGAAAGDPSPAGKIERSALGATSAPPTHSSAADHRNGGEDEKQLPAAAAHGQETATANKGANEGASKGGANAGNGRSGQAPQPPHPPHPAQPPHPAKPPHPTQQAQPPHPTQPPKPSVAHGNGSPPGPSGSGHEQPPQADSTPQPAGPPKGPPGKTGKP